jgi:putative hydrolase of the HAD superfamily
MNPIQVITFDAGGTLLYPFPSVGEVYAELAAAHGLKTNSVQLQTQFHQAWKEAHEKPRIGISEASEKNWWRGVVRRTFRDVEAFENFESLFEALWLAFGEAHRWRLHDRALETLNRLREKGFRLAILSNWDCRLRSLLEGLELMDYFDHCLISSEVGYEKPNSEIFRRAESCFQANPHQILHVGDSEYHDERGARSAGWHWVLVTHQMETPQSIHRIRNLSELLSHKLIQ